MDYLTWLTLLQEADSPEQLPELLASAGIFPSSGGAEAEVVSTLAEAWEQTALASRRLEHFTKETDPQSSAGVAAQSKETDPQSSAGVAGQSEAVPAFYGPNGQYGFGELFRESAQADMEEISRFFERDARRF